MEGISRQENFDKQRKLLIKDAEYILINPTGEFIESYYKFKTVKFNDGTSKEILNYLGAQGLWIPSSRNNNTNKLEGLNKA